MKSKLYLALALMALAALVLTGCPNPYPVEVVNTTPAATVAAPTAVTAVISTGTGTEAYINWTGSVTAASRPVGYNIYLKPNGSSVGSAVLVQPGWFVTGGEPTPGTWDAGTDSFTLASGLSNAWGAGITIASPTSYGGNQVNLGVQAYVIGDPSVASAIVWGAGSVQF